MRATYERGMTWMSGKGAWDLNNNEGERTSVKEEKREEECGSNEIRKKEVVEKKKV